jgi:hypothetical protein
MFKAGTVAGLTSAQNLVQDTQKDVNKEGTTDHKERNNTSRSTRKLNGAHHGVIPLVEIQILHFLLLFFFDIFLILYDLSRKHTNFQLNWIEGVAYKNSTILAQNLKYYPGSEFGALEVEFEPLPVGKPTKSLVG